MRTAKKIKNGTASTRNFNQHKSGLKINTNSSPHSPTRNSAYSLLNKSKSQGAFYKDFRAKSGMLIRALKIKASLERNKTSHLNVIENIDRIKTQNHFYSAQCNMKKDLKQENKSLDPRIIYQSDTNGLGIGKRTKKMPVPISTYRFNSLIIPEFAKKPITFEDLDAYLTHKSRKPYRF